MQNFLIIKIKNLKVLFWTVVAIVVDEENNPFVDGFEIAISINNNTCIIKLNKQLKYYLFEVLQLMFDTMLLIIVIQLHHMSELTNEFFLYIFL